VQSRPDERACRRPYQPGSRAGSRGRGATLAPGPRLQAGDDCRGRGEQAHNALAVLVGPRRTSLRLLPTSRGPGRAPGAPPASLSPGKGSARDMARSDQAPGRLLDRWSNANRRWLHERAPSPRGRFGRGPVDGESTGVWGRGRTGASSPDPTPRWPRSLIRQKAGGSSSFAGGRNGAQAVEELHRPRDSAPGSPTRRFAADRAC
jgi:hypothetical protein